MSHFEFCTTKPASLRGPGEFVTPPRLHHFAVELAGRIAPTTRASVADAGSCSQRSTQRAPGLCYVPQASLASGQRHGYKAF